MPRARAGFLETRASRKRRSHDGYAMRVVCPSCLRPSERRRFGRSGGADIEGDDQADQQDRARAGAQGEGIGRGRCPLGSQKKSGASVGGRGRRHGREEREVILAAVAEAQASGARLVQTCRIAGISTRTVERWRARPGGGDRRYGPHRRPSNALSITERARLMALVSSPGFAAMSPKQIVPRLADAGIYLASES